MNDKLIQILEALEPLELSAMTLLPHLRAETSEWFPTTLSAEQKTQVIAATVELVNYTQRCEQMSRRLSYLKPIPCPMALAEFGL